ncbi:MAG: hypothetical protein Harvfovirus2_1, partial [Harvfovirus sp.]
MADVIIALCLSYLPSSELLRCLRSDDKYKDLTSRFGQLFSIEIPNQNITDEDLKYFRGV